MIANTDDRSFDDVSDEDRRLALAVLEKLEKDGVHGIKSRLEKAGEPNAIRSWVSLERAMPVRAETIAEIFEDGELQGFESKTGLNREVLLDRLAHILPRVIGRLSPLGKLPSERALRFQSSELRRKLVK